MFFFKEEANKETERKKKPKADKRISRIKKKGEGFKKNLHAGQWHAHGHAQGKCLKKCRHLKTQFKAKIVLCVELEIA